ncbi:MAG TPA: TRAP transporter substrate-binding protein [Halothiobacillus sp.]|nr:MAG: ABC transporter substrate-binding protein [Rhodospirillales bacterium 20-64-7]HQT43134.1 TRAP transporter substrate-binding protein [Halothiobacillus sp.]
MTKSITRRFALQAGAALPLVGILTHQAQAAAQFTYKLATGQAPSHPVNVQAKAASARILEATGGRLQIDVFPAAQLGTDAQLLSQVRLGGVQFINLASSVLATYVPTAGIVNVGFAFNNYDQVWKAMDGELGTFISAQIGKAGLMTVGQSWDNGFRQITSAVKPIKNPADLKNFKIRVPPAPMLTSVFQALGAYPTPIDFSEVYTALQTHLVDGQENPLAIIDTAKLYEVQKYCSLSSHVWDGYWILGNPAAFKALPADIQAIVLKEFNQSALAERQASQELSTSLQTKMAAAGLTFIDVDKPKFRNALSASGFYATWKQKFGDQAWGLLEKTVGQLS